AFEEAYHARDRGGGITTRLAFERIGRPEVPGARKDDPTHEKARLRQRGKESAGLRLGIDDVVVGAVDQQEAQRVAIDRGVADGRGVEIDAAVLHRRGAEEFL